MAWVHRSTYSSPRQNMKSSTQPHATTGYDRERNRQHPLNRCRVFHRADLHFFVDRQIYYPFRDSNPERLARSLATILTALSQKTKEI